MPGSTYKSVLITGGSGKLGGALAGSGLWAHPLAPPRQELDITVPESIRRFLERNAVDAVIHCAAMARPGTCEKDPGLALLTNITGTAHLVREVMMHEQRTGRATRFIHISSDAVYPGTRGNYSEEDPTIPYNRYGWTKLGSECPPALLSNHCIVRTSFFDPHRIAFESSPTDMFSSKMPVGRLTRELSLVLECGYVGVLNIGEERRSDFERYREFKPELLPCLRSHVQQEIPFTIYHDSSMNCEKWHRIRSGLETEYTLRRADHDVN